MELVGKFSDQTNAVYAGQLFSACRTECSLWTRSSMASSELFAAMVCCTGFGVAVPVAVARVRIHEEEADVATQRNLMRPPFSPVQDLGNNTSALRPSILPLCPGKSSRLSFLSSEGPRETNCCVEKR